MYNFEHYHRANDLADAIRLLAANPGSKLISGGTDVLVSLHHGGEKYRSLVDIHALPELAGISRLEDGSLRIGSGVTFTELINSELIQKYCPAIGQAVANIAGPQIRNVATIGGNICNGATCGDSAPVSLVLDAQIEIANPQGRRFTPIDGFYTGPGKVRLAPNEIAIAFYFKPENYMNVGTSSYKYAMRGAMDISTVSCAVACRLEQGKFTMMRMAFGVAAPTPVLCPNAQAEALGKPANEETFKKIGLAALKDISPRSSWRASKEFRLQIAKTIAERVVAQAAKTIQGQTA